MMLPLQVGITGGIGAGKSVVCQVFHCLGVPIYDADRQARRLMSTDSTLIGKIKNVFGASSYHGDGTLNRAYLVKMTFGQAGQLEKLNQLVHPWVAADYKDWAGKHRFYKYIVREAALLFEAGAYKTVDKMIVVSAPEEIRIQRVKARDVHRSLDDIQAIIKSQWSEEEKIKRADYIIYNDDQQMIIPQILHLHEQFIAAHHS